MTGKIRKQKVKSFGLSDFSDFRTFLLILNEK
jgi:hypothetical protein